MVRTRIVRVDEFLEELLKYIQHGTIGAEKEYVHVSALLDDIMEQSVEPKVGIVLIKGHDLPLVHTDKVALRQVLANLVGNAFKHHDKSHGTVRVYHKRTAEFYEFFVEDDGPGVPLGLGDKIFRIFQTGQTANGTGGIGLAIVKRILSDRNLEINLQSEAGKGSTFSFTWPV
jgi:signal transduction histidine kinase